MASCNMVTILCQLIGLSASFPDVDPLPFEMSNDITAAEAELHNQVLQNRLSLQAMRTSLDGWTVPLAGSYAPQLLEAQRGSSQAAEVQLQLATRQLQEALARARLESQFRQRELPTFASQYGLASERLASQQGLASAQLFQTIVDTNPALDSLRRVAPGTFPMPLVALQQSEEVRNPSANQAQNPLVLTQSFTQYWRQKNPALAALLLEPSLYGYSLITWFLLMIVTGVSSGVCLLRAKSPTGHAAHKPHKPLASDPEVGRGQLREATQNGDPSRPSPPFGPSGRYGSLPQSDPEEEQEGMEYWTRVPVAEQFPHPRTNGHNRACQCGYIDEP